MSSNIEATNDEIKEAILEYVKQDISKEDIPDEFIEIIILASHSSKTYIGIDDVGKIINDFIMLGKRGTND